MDKRVVSAVAKFLIAACALVVAGAPQAQDKASRQAAETLSAIVGVKARILPNARSAAALGAQREGSGVLIRDGYVLTIGYLVIEAEAVEVTGADGKSVPAAVAGYDHASGFGLLRLIAPVAGKPLPLGNAASAEERTQVMIARHGGPDSVNVVNVVSRRPFSGSWEYQLDSAIFTFPPVPNWSGAALIDARGELLGIGSLIVRDALQPGVHSPGNMFVPIDLVKPILQDLVERGRAAGPVRPWLGLNAEELRGRLYVARVSPDGPADRAGLESGDIVVAVGAEEVSSLADFYMKVWAQGPAGTGIPLRVLKGTQVRDVVVRSIDRHDFFRTRSTY